MRMKELALRGFFARASAKNPSIVEERQNRQDGQTRDDLGREKREQDMLEFQVAPVSDRQSIDKNDPYDPKDGCLTGGAVVIRNMTLDKEMEPWRPPRGNAVIAEQEHHCSTGII